MTCSPLEGSVGPQHPAPAAAAAALAAEPQQAPASSASARLPQHGSAAAAVDVATVDVAGTVQHGLSLLPASMC
jgi:hypothetical protein